ncbi:MAG TPA: hypothetical protein VJ793_15565 [Anaerolineae bacterium]|nr:hypothetical protein [Anaerolineae bacterium]
MTKPRPLQTLDEVVRAVRNGAGCAVLVEGEEQASDAWILKYILLNVVGEEVTFHGRDGRERLLSELPDILRQLPNDQVFAILDRDFLEDELVGPRYAPNFSGHLFIWRRFTVENYLLEPEWVTEAVAEFYMHEPERIPEALRTAEATEEFLLDQCRRLAPQVAGNWVISDLIREAKRRSLSSVEARRYFDDLTDRDSAWVLAELTRKYGGWSGAYPELFDVEALQAHFGDRLEAVLARIQVRSSAHQVVSGKLLMKALYAELPRGAKPNREYVRNRLVRMASKQVPDDIHTLIEERILPRWRRARGSAAI